MKSELKDITIERQHFEEKALFKQRELERKIDSLQKKERCREHELVIESLSKLKFIQKKL